jgi:hypothetical protein
MERAVARIHLFHVILDLIWETARPISACNCANAAFVKDILNLSPEFIAWNVIKMLSEDRLVYHVSIVDINTIYRFVRHIGQIV